MMINFSQRTEIKCRDPNLDFRVSIGITLDRIEIISSDAIASISFDFSINDLRDANLILNS